MAISTSANVVANNMQVTIVTEALPPLQIDNGHLPPTGAMVELVNAVLKDANITGEIQVYPWARSYHMAKSTPNTLIFSIMKTDSRQNKFIWIGDIFDASVYLVKLEKRADLALNTIDDAMNKKIGIVRSDISYEYLTRKGFVDGENILQSSSYEHLWDQLYHEDIDYLLANEFMWVLEKAHHHDNAQKTTPALKLEDYSTHYYLAANKETSPLIIQTLTKSLEKLKKNGHYQAILDKWQLN